MTTLALRNTETSAILQSYDWKHHALGPIDNWPQPLRVAAQLCLNSQFPICMTWGEQHYQIYNDGYIPILGGKHPSHFGKPVAETWREIWTFLAPQLESIRITGEPVWFEDFLLPLVKSDVPEECYFTFSYSPLHGSSGQVEGVISIAYDSTAAFIARRRTTLVSDLVAATSSATAVSDLWPAISAVLRADPIEFGNARILMVDGEGRPANIDHYDDAPPINEIARQLRLDPDGRSAIDQAPRMIALSAAGDAYVLPIRGRHNNVLAAIYITPDPLCVRDASYSRLLRQVSSTIEDALHRLQAHAAEIGSMRAALAEKEALYRSLLETTLDGVFFSYPDGSILEANRAATEILGYQPDEWSRLRRGDLFVADDPALGDALRLRGETSRFSGELRMRRKDGAVVAVDLSSTILNDSSGIPIAVTIFRDITQRKAIQHRAEQAQKMEAIGQLTGGIAHDFNNLLTVILGAADDLETSDCLDPSQREKAGLIRSAAETASSLTSQLQAFARQQRLVTKRVDINQCVENTIRLLGRILGGKIELVVELAARAPSSFVLVDPQQLELAIVNMVLNSRDAMPNGGVLTIATDNSGREEASGRGGEYVAITVRDSGIGIPPENLPRIFEPFFTTKQRGQQGLGLGLSMVYGFAVQSGGSVSVKSTPGSGTAVTIVLPVGLDLPEAAPAEVGRLRQNLVVLLVDDNDLVREHVVTQLLALGFQVQTANSGEQALGRLEGGGHIDILLSDIVMPGEISGYDLAEKAKQLRPEIGILLSSGYQGSEIDRAMNAYPVLRKPYRIGELRAALDSVLAGKIQFTLTSSP